MSFIFLSHASADKSKIRHIIDALIAADIKIWLDRPHDAALGFKTEEIDRYFIRLHAGTGHYRDDIDEALRQASAVLVCWSEKAKEDRKVWHSEATVARALRKLVPCFIDEIDPRSLPDEHGNGHFIDARADLPPDNPASGWLAPKRRPRPSDELKTALDLLIQDVKLKITQNSLNRVEKRRLRDAFVPYLIDRSDQEGLIGEAIEQLSAPAGVRAFIIAGPDNECPDEFLERLKRHTSPKCLGKTWYDIYVDWPFERSPAEFATEYRRNIAQRLDLPFSASSEAIAKDIAQRDRPVAAISLMSAEEWKVGEPQRLKEWLAWWQALSSGSHRFSAIPILCIKMGQAKPGWRIYPTGFAPGATVSNGDIWRQAKRLERQRRSFWSLLGFKQRDLAKTSALPVLHPIRKTDADHWMGRHFNDVSAERKEAAQLLEALFQNSRHGVSLRDFAEAVQPIFDDKPPA